MPTYGYECKECNHAFEVVKPMGESDTKENCPCCGKEAQRIVSGGTGFILRGQGFYKNDYPKNGK